MEYELHGMQYPESLIAVQDITIGKFYNRRGIEMLDPKCIK